MMHRCAVGSCCCCRSGGGGGGGGGGIFSTSHQSPSANSPSFSFLFSAPTSHYKPLVPSFDEPFDLEHDYDHGHGNHYGSPVDCTLSLATPSTRSSSGYETDQRMSSVAAGSSCMPSLCWDLFQPPKHYSSSAAISNGNGGSGGGSGNDSLLARRCANCDTTSTPLWRNGPRGPKSLCNACGIRFKKEERRAAATTAGSGATAASPHAFNSHGSWNIHPDATSQSHNMAPLLLLHGSNQ